MKLKISPILVFFFAVTWKCFLPIKSGTAVSPFPEFDRNYINISIGGSQGGIIAINNQLSVTYPGLFIYGDTIQEYITILPGTNLIAIPRYAPIDTAYVIVFKASAVLGIDTSFVITPLRNGRSIIVENNHSVKKGAGYAGIFAVIKQNSDSLFGQCIDTIGNPLIYMNERSPFGRERIYIKKGKEKLTYHRGTDFRAQVKTPVYSIAPGIVKYIVNEDRIGKAVLIYHGANLWSSYFHLSSFKVAVGDIVSLGQMLGKTGATGSVDGPHLHISMFVDTIPVNYFTLKQIL